MFPCERASRIALPAIRRSLVIVLHARGHSTTEIARMLDMTPAAVSQYLRGKRGVRLKVSPVLVERIADKLERGEDVREDVCRLCREVLSVATR